MGLTWTAIQTVDEFNQLLAHSENYDENFFLVYKHSTRCSISSMALRRLENDWIDELSLKIKPYFIDVIAKRNVSDQIAKQLNVQHESPQAILVKNGQAVESVSHMAISGKWLLENIKID